MKSFFRTSTLLYLVVVVTTALFATTTTAHADQQGEDSKWNQGSHDVNDIVTQERLGRILKKDTKKEKKTTTKEKKKAKSNAPSKRPSKSCYTTAQSADFVTALTNAFSSGATSVELVICDGNTIEIPEPITINLDTPQNSRRILQGGAARMLSIRSFSPITGFFASILYNGQNDVSSLITFSSDTTSTLDLTSTASTLYVTLNGINLSSSSSSTVAYFFDVSNLSSIINVVTDGSYIIGNNVGTPFLHNKDPVQAVCCDSCSVPT
jgi:hypothetical protein